MDGARPIVAVRTTIVERRTIIVASGGQEESYAVITFYDSPQELTGKASEFLCFFPNPTERGRMTYELRLNHRSICFQNMAAS